MTHFAGSAVSSNLKSIDKSGRKQIPYATVVRLTQYMRVLERLIYEQEVFVSSATLAYESGVKDTLVRKDFAYFGEFGIRGLGYPVPQLLKDIKTILALNEPREAIVVGAGNLGQAVIHYTGFAERGFDLKAVFDSDMKKIGNKLNEFTVQSVGNIGPYLQENPKIEIGILALPSDSVQFVADILVTHGIRGLLSFASRPPQVPDEVVVVTVDLTTHLEVLSFYLGK